MCARNRRDARQTNAARTWCSLMWLYNEKWATHYREETDVRITGTHYTMAPPNSVRISSIRRARFREMVPSLLLLSAYIARSDDIDIAVLHKRRRRRRDKRTKQGPTYNTWQTCHCHMRNPDRVRVRVTVFFLYFPSFTHFICSHLCTSLSSFAIPKSISTAAPSLINIMFAGWWQYSPTEGGTVYHGTSWKRLDRPKSHHIVEQALPFMNGFFCYRSTWYVSDDRFVGMVG